MDYDWIKVLYSYIIEKIDREVYDTLLNHERI